MTNDSGWPEGPQSLGAPPSLPLPAPPVPAPPRGPAFGASPPPPPATPINFGQAAPTPPTPSGSNTRRNVIIATLGLAVVVGLLFAFLSAGDSDQPIASSNSLSEDPTTPPADAETTPEDTEDEGSAFFVDPFRPDSVAFDASSVWVSDSACGVVIQIDKATEEVVGGVIVGESASGVAVAGGSVWVGTRDEGKVVRIDPSRLQVGGSVSVPGSALGLTARGNDVWATDPINGFVYRIDATRSALVDTVSVGFDPHHVAIGDSTVWVTNQLDDTVSMIATGSAGSERAVPVGSRPLHVELGGGSAWVTDSADGAVRRLDENTGEVQAVISVGVWPHALAYANGSVWVGTETGSFWKIDPNTNAASRVDDADFASIDTTVDGNNIWIADANGGIVVRFDAAAGEVGSIIDLNEFGDCATFRDEAEGEPRRGADL